MACPTCGARIEATAPLWLTLTADGWTVFGVGGEDLRTYCQNDHEITLTDRDLDTLTDYLLGIEKMLDAEVPADA